MGMTIDEPIQTLEYLRDSGVFPFSSKEGVLYTTESIDVAIDTVRKYEKIEQIIKTAGIFAFDVPEIRRIAEVIKYGNEY